MYHTSINQQMEKGKDFNEWRAKQLGYVYFSRFKDLIIKESGADNPFFDYLIDTGENGKQTGRLFGVEVKALSDTNIKIKILVEQCKNVSFPVLLVAFDNKTDDDYFKWNKKPKEDGRLLLDYTKANLTKLENASLNQIVQQVKDWYEHKSVFSE